MLLTIDPLYWLMLAPALILGLWAQARVRSAFARAQEEPAPMTGAAAARYVLDSAGLQNVSIEPVQGYMTDHYDPREKCCGSVHKFTKDGRWPLLEWRHMSRVTPFKMQPAITCS